MHQKFAYVTVLSNIYRDTQKHICKDIRGVHNNKQTNDLCFYVPINSKFEIISFFGWVVVYIWLYCFTLKNKTLNLKSNWNKLKYNNKCNKCNKVKCNNNYLISINDSIWIWHFFLFKIKLIQTVDDLVETFKFLRVF